MVERPDQERAFEQLLGRVLQTGVLVSATLVACGGIVYLAKRGSAVPDYHVFAGEPADLRSIGGIVADAHALTGRGLIQLGLLALIATPIVRVALSIAGFLRQGDWLYVGITLAVFLLLLYSLLAS